MQQPTLEQRKVNTIKLLDRVTVKGIGEAEALLDAVQFVQAATLPEPTQSGDTKDD